MPNNVWELPPVVDTGDSPNRRAEELATIVPKDRRKPYNMRKLLELVVDKDSVFEIQPTYCKAVITSLARINGKVVGIIANNPMIYGGALDLKSSRKQTHFIQLCDTFHVPLIFLVDVPGFMVGKDAELAGTLREGMRSVYVAMQATVPILTVVLATRGATSAGSSMPRRPSCAPDLARRCAWACCPEAAGEWTRSPAP